MVGGESSTRPQICCLGCWVFQLTVRANGKGAEQKSCSLLARGRNCAFATGDLAKEHRPVCLDLTFGSLPVAYRGTEMESRTIRGNVEATSSLEVAPVCAAGHLFDLNRKERLETLSDSLQNCQIL